MNVNDILKNRLKEERMKKGYTQQELAEMLGANNRNISKYEAGTTQPNYEMLCMMADIFDCSVDYLVGRSPHRDYRIESQEIDGETYYFGVLKSAEKLTKEEKIQFATKLLNDANKN